MLAQIFYLRWGNTKPEEEKIWFECHRTIEEENLKPIRQALVKGMYTFIGEIEVENREEVFTKLQNGEEEHELHNRSMCTGDVCILGDNTVWICASIGWIEITNLIDFFVDLI